MDTQFKEKLRSLEVQLSDKVALIQKMSEINITSDTAQRVLQEQLDSLRILKEESDLKLIQSQKELKKVQYFIYKTKIDFDF